MRVTRRAPDGVRRVTGTGLQRAGVLFLGRIEDFHRLIRRGNGGSQRDDIPFVLGLALWVRREGIGFLHQLMIPGPEIGLARLEDVELGFFFEIGDQLVGVGRLGLVHGLRHDLERDVFDPGVVVRRLAVLLGEVVDKGPGGRDVEGVIPDRRPNAGEVAFTRGPGVGGIEVEADDRIGQAEFGILLDQGRHLIAGQVGADHVGLGLAYLQKIRAEVGHVGGDQLVADQVALIGREETLGRGQQIMAENIVGGQPEELLVLHHVVAQQRLADGIHHHRVRDVGVERVSVAVLAAQRVGARAGLNEQPLVAGGHLHDGQRGGRIDLAHQHGSAVLLEQALGLGRGGGGIDRILPITSSWRPMMPPDLLISSSAILMPSTA